MGAYSAAGLPLRPADGRHRRGRARDAIALTRHAAELGFAGALVLPPFYYKGVPDDGLVAYLGALVEATARAADPDLSLSLPGQFRHCHGRSR